MAMADGYFFKTYKPLLTFACLIGICPLSFISSNSGRNVRFAVISWQFVYSVAIIIFTYISTLEITVAYIREVTSSTVRDEKVPIALDGFAVGVFLALLFFMYHITPLLILLKTRNLVKLTRAFSNYDEKFPGKVNIREAGIIKLTFNPYFIVISLCVSIHVYTSVNVTIPVFQSILEISNASGKKFLISLIIPDTTWASWTSLLFHLINQLFSLLFFLMSIIFLTVALHRRIGEFNDEFCEQFSLQDHVFLPKKTTRLCMIAPLPVVWITSGLMREAQFGCQRDLDKEIIMDGFLIRFQMIVKVIWHFNGFAREFLLMFIVTAVLILIMAFYIILILAVSPVDLPTEGVYHVFGYTFGKDEAATLGVIIVIAVLVCVVTDCGEKIEDIGRRLRFILSCCPGSSLSPSVAAKLACLQNMAFHAPFYLTACGFFKLNRALMTSIVGSVITFIIVMTQFRISDIQQVKSG